MSNLPVLTVMAATGAQGASVVDALRALPSPKYHIRALTKNTSSEAAKELQKYPNVSVEYVDIESIESLTNAFRDSVAIFGNTYFSFQVFSSKGPAAARDTEAQQGMNVVQAASKTATLKHFIWSTLPDILTISGGKYDIAHIQSKIPAERYIQNVENGLAHKTTILRLPLYGSNLAKPPYTPALVADANKYAVILPLEPDKPVPFTGDERANVGLMVEKILSNSKKTLGRMVLGAVDIVSPREWTSWVEAALRSQRIDVGVSFVQCTPSTWEELWGPIGMKLGTTFRYLSDCGPLQAFQEDSWGDLLTLEDIGLQSGTVSGKELLKKADWTRYAG